MIVSMVCNKFRARLSEELVVRVHTNQLELGRHHLMFHFGTLQRLKPGTWALEVVASQYATGCLIL